MVSRSRARLSRGAAAGFVLGVLWMSLVLLVLMAPSSCTSTAVGLSGAVSVDDCVSTGSSSSSFSFAAAHDMPAEYDVVDEPADDSSSTTDGPSNDLEHHHHQQDHPHPQEGKEVAVATEEDLTLFHRAVDELYIERNFTAALEFLHAAAAEGDPRSTALLAVFYTHGIGVNRSEAKAILLYEFAALGGSVDAHLALSHRYEHGLGVPQSCANAAKHAQKAANEVAVKHASDITAKVNFVDLEKEADTASESLDTDVLNAAYFRAEKGVSSSKVFLGYTYMLGLHGVAQDGHLAEKYFKEAAQEGEVAAHGALGQMYSQGVSSAKPPIEKDPELAYEHFVKGAEKNHEVSLNGLGYLYASGNGAVEQSFPTAARYFRESAGKNNAEGMYNLGVLYLNGKGVPKDVNQAAQLFLQAAVRGSVLANWQLGHMNMLGKGGLPKSCQTALKNYRLVIERGPWVRRIHAAYEAYHSGDYNSALLDYMIAAESGSSVALRNAAFLLHRGHTFEGVSLQRNNETLSQDEVTTQVLLSLLLRSAREGHPDAHLKLGDYYYYGVGTETNYAKAVEHYQIAAGSNNPQALFNLGLMHQHGGSIGLEQDFHLAKRYYDQALSVSPSAYYAVNAALYYLNFRWWYTHFSDTEATSHSEYGEHTSEDPLSQLAGAMDEALGGTGTDGVYDQQEEGVAAPAGLREALNFGLNLVLGMIPQPLGLPFDTFLLYLCTGLAAFMLLLRHHAVDG